MKPIITKLLNDYIYEYCRTTGKDGTFVISYKSGWFRLNSGDKVRRAELEKMIETLKLRPTVADRDELVNGVVTNILAHQHVVKSIMAPYKDVIEDRDTPNCCSVASETYWSM